MSDDLQKRVSELEEELRDLYEDVELLQDEIMKKDAIISELTDPKGSKKGITKAIESKIKIELDTKDKEIRDLKDKMGFLRKENVQLKQEIQKLEKPKSSTVIPIEKKEVPLNALVKELQNTIAKLRSENRSLKSGKKPVMEADSGEMGGLDKKIKEKDEEIKSLKLQISELNKELEHQGSFPILKKKPEIKEALTAELQEKLNKSRAQIDELKVQLNEQKDNESKRIKEKEVIIEKLTAEVDKLKSDLSIKAKTSSAPMGGVLPGLSTELQGKLNKARKQIQSLENRIKELEEGKEISRGPVISDAGKDKLMKEMNINKEKIALLEKKIKEQEHILSVKEQRIISLSQKAKPSQEGVIVEGLDENSPLALRIRELSSIIGDLKKQNNQQRLELSQLRKT